MEAMTMLHETAGRAFTLESRGSRRTLWVLEGKAWVTRADARPGEPPADLWLRPGATLDLPAGSRWIVEAVGGPLRLGLRAPAARTPARARAPWRLARALAALGARTMGPPALCDDAR